MAKHHSLPATPQPTAVKDSPHRARLGEIYKGDDWEATSEIACDPNTTEVDEAVRRAALQPRPTGEIKDAWKHLRRRAKVLVILNYSMLIFLALFAFVLGQFFPYQTSYLRGHVAHSNPDGVAQPRSWSESAKRSFNSTIGPGVPQYSAVASSSMVNVTAPSQTASAAPQTSTSGSPMRRVPVAFRVFRSFERHLGKGSK